MTSGTALVPAPVARLNRGLLGLRVALYAVVLYGLVDAGAPVWVVLGVAGVVALPAVRHRATGSGAGSPSPESLYSMPSDRAVVVLHEGWGRSDDIESVSRRFEHLGFRVCVPDLFGGRSPGRALPRAVPQLGTGAGGSNGVPPPTCDGSTERATRFWSIRAWGYPSGSRGSVRTRALQTRGR